MIDRGKHNILGVRIDAVDYALAVERIVQHARSRQPLAVTALAVHGVMTGVLDPIHAYRLNHLDLVVPDGQPVRWALNWLYGTKLCERVYGPELMLCVCERATAEKLPIYLFGGTKTLLDPLQVNLLARFPGLQIVGARASAFRRLQQDERDALVTDIRNSGARIVLVGLGCPRQEVWAFEFREALSVPILAVGAAFNFHAGLLPQAPASLQRYGLEWLFRLAHEPRRLAYRYLVLNPLYVSLLFLQLLRVRTLDPSRGVQPVEEWSYG